MCVLSKPTLLARLHEFIKDPDPNLVNPASVDIRIGQHLKYEDDTVFDLTKAPYVLQPKEFVLVSTYEHLMVPLDCAMELKLKSTRARQGYDHSLAFWFDPGWDGVGTFEIMNNYREKPIALEYGMRFAQIIVHKLDIPIYKDEGYQGRYQHASSVEAAK